MVGIAEAHALALEAADAAGERFLLSSGPAIEMKDIGATIRAHLGDVARRAPARTIPNVALRAAAKVNPE